MTEQQPPPRSGPSPRRRWPWAVAAGAVLIALVGAGVTVWLVGSLEHRVEIAAVDHVVVEPAAEQADLATTEEPLTLRVAGGLTGPDAGEQVRLTATVDGAPVTLAGPDGGAADELVVTVDGAGSATIDQLAVGLDPDDELHGQPGDVELRAEWAGATGSAAVGVRTRLPAGALVGFGDNRHGELMRDPDEHGERIRPRIIDDQRRWADVAAGNEHTLGLTADGELYAWGAHGHGRTGVGESDGADHRPQRVEGDGAVRWLAVSTLFEHAVAIDEDGRLHVWGRNTHGQLAQDPDDDPHPAPEVVEVDGVEAWRDVAGGKRRSVGLSADGRIFQWGVTDWQDYDLEMHAPGGEDPEPQEVGADRAGEWTRVVAGGHMSAALDEEGWPWVWGWRGGHRLGLDAEDLAGQEPEPVALQADGVDGWQQVESTMHHSLGLSDDGEAWVWGMGAHGRLGVEFDEDELGLLNVVRVERPERVPTDDAAAPLQRIGLGNRHSLVIDADGELWSWGWNAYGQAGHDLEVEEVVRAEPVGIGDVEGSRLAGGSFHSVLVGPAAVAFDADPDDVRVEVGGDAAITGDGAALVGGVRDGIHPAADGTEVDLALLGGQGLQLSGATATVADGRVGFDRLEVAGGEPGAHPVRLQAVIDGEPVALSELFVVEVAAQG